jgi:NTE family protein
MALTCQDVGVGGDPSSHGPVAFVLGGGGVLGAVEVGMLRALLRAQIKPDMVFATSIGAINAAHIAADPSPSTIDTLVRLWATPEIREVYGDSVPQQLRRFATRTPLHSPEPLRRILARTIGAQLTFAQLPVPLQVSASVIERAAEHWFTEGPLLPAVLAAAAVPGLLPPLEIDGEHFMDSTMISLPISRAIAQGAREVFMLQVGRFDKPLSPPQRPWEGTNVATEIARRVRFARELEATPAGVRVHVLPGGSDADESPWAYRDNAAVRRRVSAAYIASRDYLAAIGR